MEISYGASCAQNTAFSVLALAVPPGMLAMVGSIASHTPRENEFPFTDLPLYITPCGYCNDR
jgi:hypothetical protein